MSEITSLSQLDLQGYYTYQDYLSWKFQERVELIKGRIFKMSPAPNRNHQAISIFFSSELYFFLKGKECKVYDAPFDVVLTKNDNATVIQPDICVVCDPTKLTDQGCTGAPELIIEILSPGNSKKEKKEKFELYEENGVLEYWLVSPNENTIIVYTLDTKGKYIGSKPFVTGEQVKSAVLKDFVVSVDDVFQE
jgi:Uma2 family endonuclease